MTHEKYIICITGMAFVTFIPRWIPLIWLSDRTIPPLFIQWLRFVPASILSALVLPSLILNKTGDMSFTRSEFLVAIPTLLFAWWSRSMGGTVLMGMVLYYIAGHTKNFPAPPVYMYFTTNLISGIICVYFSKDECVDCRLIAGTNKKPDFWK